MKIYIYIYIIQLTWVAKEPNCHKLPAVHGGAQLHCSKGPFAGIARGRWPDRNTICSGRSHWPSGSALEVPRRLFQRRARLNHRPWGQLLRLPSPVFEMQPGKPYLGTAVTGRAANRMIHPSCWRGRPTTLRCQLSIFPYTHLIWIGDQQEDTCSKSNLGATFWFYAWMLKIVLESRKVVITTDAAK